MQMSVGLRDLDLCVGTKALLKMEDLILTRVKKNKDLKSAYAALYILRNKTINRVNAIIYQGT